MSEKYTRGIRLTWNGETHTIREWSHLTGIAWWSIADRNRRGLSPEQIFTARIIKKPRRQFVYNGESHTVGEWSRILGINQTTISNRLKDNLPLEKVFKLGRLNAAKPRPPKRPRSGRPSKAEKQAAGLVPASN